MEEEVIHSTVSSGVGFFWCPPFTCGIVSVTDAHIVAIEKASP
jgi:hypothetical protein